MHVHALEGCAPAPLAYYLKALAVLRLVGEQADAGARGWWKDDVFHLATRLDERDLLDFFCSGYAPTPILNPWNGGGGFYFRERKSAERDPTTGKRLKTGVRDEATAATRALESLISSSNPRLKRYAEIARSMKAAVAKRGLAAAPSDENKAALVAELRARLGEPALAWLDTVMLSTGDRIACPPTGGSGGNDGNDDFAKNFLETVLTLLDNPERDCLRTALYRTPEKGLRAGAPGQFFPGGNGGTNAGAGFNGDATANPWDLVFALEGAVVLRVAATRRLDASEPPAAAAPFWFPPTAAGSGAMTASEEAGRGEQWLPLWARPALSAEVAQLFEEGRMVFGRRSARRTLEAAAAVARLGAARGLTSFTRFGQLPRNGKNHYSVVLGRHRVTHRPEARLLDEIDTWLSRLRRASGSKTAPAAFGRACRVIEGHALAACQPTATKESWGALVMALGDAEALLSARPKATAETMLMPVPPLSHAWFDALDDGSPEARIALAIASQRAPWRPGKEDELGAIRAHCIPLDLASRTPRFATSADGLRKDPRVVWTGRELAADLASIAVRRAVEAKAHGFDSLPLVGSSFATLGDVAAFLEGRTNDARIASLARGLMALDWSTPPPHRPPPPTGRGLALHALVRVAYLPARVGTLEPRCEPTALRLLSAGRLSEGVRAATSRLVAMGLRPKLRVVAGDPPFARRLAASAAIPVSLFDLRRLLDLAAKPFDAFATTMENS